MKSPTVEQTRSWFIASRWQEFEGEMRASLLRAAMVVGFYTMQLVHHFSLTTVSLENQVYHRQVTLAALAWLFISLTVFVMLKGNFFPAILKYVTSTCDIALIGALAFLGHGSDSPLIYTLFIVVVLAGLRFSLGLVWFTTLASMVVYMLLVGTSDNTWFDANHETPVLTQAIVLLALGSVGIVVGQMVRSTRKMAEAYQSRIASVNEGVGQ